MKLVVCLIVIWKCIWCAIKSVNGDPSAEAELSVKELTRKYGYPLEIFTNVTTEDKYLLDVFRISRGKSMPNNSSKPVVLLMHGLLGSSRDFMIVGPERGLPYLLADRNYDVWMGNARGTPYSRKHLVLNPDVDAKFWEFSWHEIGIYDLPAIITLIKNITGKEQMNYIGISQGATIFYVLTSMRPEFNKNINLMISFAPAVYMAHMSSPIPRLFATYEPILTPLSKLLGIHEFPPQPLSRLLSLAAKILCPIKGFFEDLCAEVFFLTGGYDPPQLNKTILSVVLGNISSSTRQLLHFAQNINSGKFRQFNFGRRNNLKKYGSIQPPSYNLSNVVSPVAVFYGEGDWLTNSMDVERLSGELPNCVYIYKVPHPLFNHFDFVTATDVVMLVFENVFTLLEKYNKNVE